MPTVNITMINAMQIISSFIQSPFGQPCEIVEFTDINGVSQSGYIRAWGRGLCSLYEGYD